MTLDDFNFFPQVRMKKLKSVYDVNQCDPNYAEKIGKLFLRFRETQRQS